jgi:protocatechuate 3,4-dioxygenase alpha subunit
MLPETASQTAGPYVHIGLLPRQAGFDIFANNIGTAPLFGGGLVVTGRIFDGTGALVRDALVEAWQAGAAGEYGQGWARLGTDFDTGIWTLRTEKPGAVIGRSGHGMMAPHINLWIVARGINTGLATRLYFADEDAANAADPVLRMIEPSRRGTLIAARTEVGYNFDIRLQGEGETVFLDL